MEEARTATAIRNSNPVIGGILSIICGSVNLVMVGVDLITRFVHYHTGGLAFPPTETFRFTLNPFYLTLLIAGVLAITGGILAAKRRYWPLSLIGTIASIISFTGLLGILATVLVAISRKQFE